MTSQKAPSRSDRDGQNQDEDAIACANTVAPGL
jgi:hypothetical protein